MVVTVMTSVAITGTVAMVIAMVGWMTIMVAVVGRVTVMIAMVRRVTIMIAVVRMVVIIVVVMRVVAMVLISPFLAFFIKVVVVALYVLVQADVRDSTFDQASDHIERQSVETRESTLLEADTFE